MQFYFILFLKIFRIEDHFSEKQKQSKHPTAEPWPAIFPNLKPCSSAMRMWTDLVLNLLWVFTGYLWKLVGDDFSSSLQASAFSSQFIDHLSGLCEVTVMPFIMVRSVERCWYFRARFCVLQSSCDVVFCYSSLFHLSFIFIDRYVAVTDPLVYPTKFKVSVSGVCISISWILPLVYSRAVSYTGVSDDGMEELVSALNCIWVLISVLLFFIPTVVMILYGKIF